MKERPIIFNAPMVRAILDGRKTQARRVVKCKVYDIERLAHPQEWNAGRADDRMVPYEEWGQKRGCGLFESTTGTIFAMPCPYGKPGDRLWVRETIWLYPDRKEIAGYVADCGNKFEGYARKVPSIFMPRWASRIILEITEIRVERLQDITHQDAWREGINLPAYAPVLDTKYPSPTDKCKELWDSINAKKHPWSSNPWVWVISFKRIQ